MIELDVFRSADFDWVRHLDSVWEDCAYDVPGVHEEIRKEFETKIIQYAAAEDRRSPLGWVIQGMPGSGKTHLVGAFRKMATSLGANFVMVDMTDIHDFWETVLQGFLSSLQQPFEKGKLQSELVLECLLRLAGVRKSRAKKIADLSAQKREKVAGQILAALVRQFPHEGPAFQDIVRALLLLNSNDLDQKNVGFGWLQGLSIEDQVKAAHGFLRSQAKPMDIVRGLSWIMSTRGLTVVVFDQLDAIVNQHNIMAGGTGAAQDTDETRASKAIIEGLAGGLLSIRDVTSKTLTVISCLQSTWSIFEKEAHSPATDRYEPSRQLYPIGKSLYARQMIANRLAPTYDIMDLNPAYPTWPFKESVFESAEALSPRELLKRCDSHRLKCIADGRVTEIDRFWEAVEAEPTSIPEALQGLNELLEERKRQVELAALFEEENEDALLEALLRTACHCLIQENPLPANIDAVVDVDFPGGKVRALHARIRLMFREEKDREEHVSLRFIERKNAVAFQNRLKAAVTASGIDKSLPFRRLILLRNAPLPGGRKTEELVQAFFRAGGIIARPEEDEIRTLWALHVIKKESPLEFTAWLKSGKPASRLRLLDTAVRLFERYASPNKGGNAFPTRPE